MVMAKKSGILASLRNVFTSSYQTTGSGQRSARFNPPNLGPVSAVDQGANKLRAQSRDLARKNTLAASAVERIVSSAVGTGIKPKIPAKALRELWDEWTKKSAPDGQLDFYGQQAQVLRNVVTAGEIFVRMRARFKWDGLTVPFQIELLESEYVPMEKNEVLPDGNFVINGIEFDKDVRSKRVAYWMYKNHPNDRNSRSLFGPDLPVRVPAEEVIHVYLPERPGQVRGEPWLKTIIDRMLDVESYDKAELVRKKTTAMFAGFIKRPVGNSLTLDELEDIWGAADDPNGSGVANVTLEPGTMQTLAPGEEIEFADPKDVGGQYETFLRNQYRLIASGVGILYEQLTGDYSLVNDRTWRAAMNDFRRRVEMWQHHLMVFQFCRPIWRRWALFARIQGFLVDPSKEMTWTPPTWPYINPVQDVQARREEVLAGFTSRQRVVSEMGEDASVIDKEQAGDNARADDLELSYESDGRKAASLPTEGLISQTKPAIGHADEQGNPVDEAGNPVDPNAPPAAPASAPKPQHHSNPFGGGKK
jgi:lambda family phage portal protein